MDLDAFEALADSQDAGVVVEILDPVTGEATGATITICGPDSRHARKARREALRAALAASDDPDELDLATAMLARCVIAWKGVQRGGKDLECTVENAETVFRRFPWIETQCDRKASDRRNFIKG